MRLRPQGSAACRSTDFSNQTVVIPSSPPRVLDALFNFLLVWYYCTLTIRESILISNGSRCVPPAPRSCLVLSHVCISVTV